VTGIEEWGCDVAARQARAWSLPARFAVAGASSRAPDRRPRSRFLDLWGRGPIRRPPQHSCRPESSTAFTSATMPLWRLATVPLVRRKGSIAYSSAAPHPARLPRQKPHLGDRDTNPAAAWYLVAPGQGLFASRTASLLAHLVPRRTDRSRRRPIVVSCRASHPTLDFAAMSPADRLETRERLQARLLLRAPSPSGAPLPAGVGRSKPLD